MTALAGLCPVLFIKHSTYITAKERYAITSCLILLLCTVMPWFDALTNAMSFVRIYIMLVFAGAVFNAVAGLDLMTSVSAAIACTGNVGPGFGQVWTFFGVLAIYPQMTGLAWME